LTSSQRIWINDGEWRQERMDVLLRGVLGPIQVNGWYQAQSTAECGVMPEISRFYGIVIRMFYNDHAPPHFHAAYGDHELVVGLSPIVVMAGSAPARVGSMVLEWAAVHRQELVEDWERCRTGEPPRAIAPLD